MADWRREQRELNEHLLVQDWDVFGTLKFVDGRTIGSVTALKLLRSYWNRMDRVFFGHAAERKNIRLPRWCFAHEGSDAENFHIHFLLKSPLTDTEQACCVLNSVWAQHHRQTGTLDDLRSEFTQQTPSAAQRPAETTFPQRIPETHGIDA